METSSQTDWAVQSLTIADAAQVVDHYMLFSQADLELRFFIYLPDSVERRRDILTGWVHDFFKRNECQHLGIREPAGGNALIGLASWGAVKDKPGVASFAVSVVPAWRGKRLTMALLDRACGDAVQAGLTTMQVDYRPGNQPVMGLLQSINAAFPLDRGLSAAQGSLAPYAAEIRRQVEALAAFLEVVGLGPQPAKL
jgi:hypothetical protein